MALRTGEFKSNRTNHNHNDQQNDFLLNFLTQIDLSDFYYKLVNDVKITKLEYLRQVDIEDLEKIGMSRPAARRLLEAYRKTYLTRSKGSSAATNRRPSVSVPNSNQPQLTNVFSSIPLSCIINREDITIKNKLGSGVFGVVYRGEWRQHGSKNSDKIIHVALKQLRQDLDKLQNTNKSEFIREVSAMNSLNHKNLIKLYGVVMSSPQMIVTELASLGSLQQALRAIDLDPIKTEQNSISSTSSVSISNLHLSLAPLRLKKLNNSNSFASVKRELTFLIDKLMKFCFQICSGMEFLENKRFLHRDLATRNILLTNPDKVKIADFGLVRALPQGEDFYQPAPNSHRRLPFAWCAPEVLRSRRFSHASDVWMLGVTWWEMFSYGTDPWPGIKPIDLLTLLSEPKFERLQRPSRCPSSIYRLMLRCWSDDPSNRPSFAQLLSKLESIPKPFQVRALQKSVDPSKLTFEKDDVIIVTESIVNDNSQIWMGQNCRTLKFGSFPRNIVENISIKQLTTNDISSPIKNSFIHTGHFGRKSQNHWGSPSSIDEAYLKNPLIPPDLIYGLPTNKNSYNNVSLLDINTSTQTPPRAESPFLIDLDSPVNVLHNMKIPARGKVANEMGSDFSDSFTSDSSEDEGNAPELPRRTSLITFDQPHSQSQHLSSKDYNLSLQKNGIGRILNKSDSTSLMSCSVPHQSIRMESLNRLVNITSKLSLQTNIPPPLPPRLPERKNKHFKSNS